jgi:hypothetical protein
MRGSVRQLGGAGGGGNGAGNSTNATGGTANTGGGGGGGGRADLSPPASYSGGDGGSGIVIIRYAGGTKATGGTITTSGSYTIHTFTTSGTFTPTSRVGVYDQSPSNSTLIDTGISYDSAGGGNWAFTGTSGQGIIVKNSSSATIGNPYLNLKTSQGGQGYTAIVWARSTGGLSSWRKLFAHADGDNYLELYQSPSGYYHQDGCGSTLYVDGVNVANDSYYMVNAGWHCYAATNSNAGTLTNPGSVLTIGNEPNLTSYPWVGNIAMVKYYNIVLTATELAQSFQAHRGRFGI